MTVYATGEASRQRYGVQQGVDPQQLPPVLASMLLMQLQELAQSDEGLRRIGKSFKR